MRRPQFFFAIAVIPEILALIALRIRRPDLHRPWRIPLGTIGTTALVAPPLVIVVIVAALSFLQSARTMATCGSVLILTLAMSSYCQLRGLHGRPPEGMDRKAVMD